MFSIDIMSRVPVYEQIIKQAEKLILMGILKPGEKMPSVRSLSIHLAVNPNTIQKAYAQLEQSKVIQTVPGKGSYVSQNAVTIIELNSREKLGDLKNMLRTLEMAGVERNEIIQVVDEIFKQ